MQPAALLTTTAGRLSFPVSTLGVDSFDVSLEKQKAFVKGTADYDTVLEKIKKTGKEVKGGRTVA